MSQRVWLDTPEARKLLLALTGFRPEATVIHAAVQSKKIRSKVSEKPGRAYHGNSKRILFHRSDLETFAARFNEMRDGHLSIQESFRILAERFPSLSLGQFVTLVEGSTVLPVAARLWKMNFFRKKDVQDLAEKLTDEEVQKLATASSEELLTIRQSVDYLAKKLQRSIKRNTLYVMMERGNLVPAVSPPPGNREGYKFTKASLDAITYREHLRKPRDVPPIVPIRSSEDMSKLVEQWGELVSTTEAVRIVKEQNNGQPHDEPTLKRRLRRRVQPVGKSGLVLYYPKQRVRELTLYPLHGASATPAVVGE